MSKSIFLTCFALVAVALFSGVKAGPTTPSDDYLPDVIFGSDLPHLQCSRELFERLKDHFGKLELMVTAGNDTDSKVDRFKRSAENTTNHWCCILETPPPQTATRDIVRSRVIEKQIPITSQRSCGWFRKCTTTTYRTEFVIEYYMDTDIYEVPAPEWVNGCPRDLINCCEGYMYFPPYFTNCLTPEQMGELLEVYAGLMELGLLTPETFGAGAA